jgi:hypothetical protein
LSDLSEEFTLILTIRGVDFDIDYYVVVAKGRLKMSLSKQATQNLDVQIFNLKRLNSVEN